MLIKFALAQPPHHKIYVVLSKIESIAPQDKYCYVTLVSGDAFSVDADIDELTAIIDRELKKCS